MSFEEYLATVTPVRAAPGAHEVDVEEHVQIRAAALQISDLGEVTRATLESLVSESPNVVRALGLAVGLSRERLRNHLRHRFDTSGWVALARSRPHELIEMLDEDFGVVAIVTAERRKVYDFGDILVERSGTRQRAGEAIAGGRAVEDAIEALTKALGLPYKVRSRFVGRDGADAPCDLAVPGDGREAKIVCAAKGFDSTGSKLTDAVREIEQMAAVRLPTQFVFAVVDGIGWKSRQADLRRIFALRETDQIDGLYTLAMLDQFSADLAEAFHRLGLR